MRLGFSNRVLASLFHLKNKRSVSYTIHSARLTLMKNFTHHYIGLQHVDRQTVIDHHQTSIASELFTTTPDQLCILMDGTYIYIQKSSYYEMQRRTYSLHKHRHLVKPMMITPSNFILNSTRPFPEPKQLKQRIRVGITSTRFSEKAVIPGKVPDFDRQPPLKIPPFDSAQNSASNTTKMKFNTTI
ncbi:unnamed protein product [Rotaria socialis]|uniref:Uncharacterized protein n=1 Tax=Rotaria socialis TaxID=392032 RepID=A0A817UPM6_9BILA|nr:unnamed protein product [Rotaria socialis]